jgi:N,N'-diacetylchitobiose phosphorylase
MPHANATAGAPCFRTHLLSNGRYAVLLSPWGGGYSALAGLAITRWVPDPTCDAAGFLIYIRDVESGAFWTIGGGMAAAATQHARFDGGFAGFAAVRDDIEAQLRVCIDPAHDAELRRLAVRNIGQRARLLEITTYAELSLNSPAADAAHPAFSKLFVQTEHVSELNALLAWRRPRSPDDRPLWAAHRLLLDVPCEGRSTVETDRMRFLGRGRDAGDPAAMHGELGGTTGSVLDPVFSARCTVRLEPGASAVFAAVLCAASSRDSALATIAAFPHEAAGAETFSAAAPERAHVAALGLPQRWRESMDLHVGDSTQYDLGGSVEYDHVAERVARERLAVPASPDTMHDELQFFNGWGGFSSAGDEYVIRLPLEGGAPRRPPMPWVNVIANEDAGCIVSEGGATYTWTGNSRENRLTPWSNDPVSDPHGEALYIRDADSGAVWSPLPGPAPGAGAYETRHGFGRTEFIHASQGIESRTSIFVPADAPVRIARVELHNTDAVPRRLSVISYAQLVLGSHEADTRGLVESWNANGVLFARNPHRGEFSQRVAFAATVSASARATTWTCDRAGFIGSRGSVAAPAAVRDGHLAQRAGTGLDPCFALAADILLAPDETLVVGFLLGEAAGEAESVDVVRRFADGATIADAQEAVRTAWRQRLGVVRSHTPSPALDLMLNGWLAYQNLGCRMWARSAYYQSGGAFGFRDQLQDSSALLYIDPHYTRTQILLHAAHQFVEGDVLHWWHPPLSKGIRTRFSDDLLWLPYITAFYIGATGDTAILDEVVPYLRARQLEEGHDEAFLVPDSAGESSSLFEHCCRAIDRSLTKGTHGLPLMGAGDWNDGMNRVGREGRGESVWLGFFLFDILRDFIPIVDSRGDAARAAAYSAYRHELGRALNEGGWDGAWYRRAYYDDGAPLGSARSDECRIDALAQAWAVLSGAAPADRAALALDALEQHLVSEDEGLIRLLAPPFDRTPHDPGYIKGYIPGVRENGGQYTHGVLWAVRALAQERRHERAARLLEMLSPVTRGGSAANAQRYMVEPYVVAADVYGVDPHVGRGGWTWYTGSAGWMYRIALESILGLSLQRGRALRLQPCIPADWPGFSLHYRLPDGTRYDISVTRAEAGAVRAWLDDVEVAVSGGTIVIALAHDARAHALRVEWP